MKTTAKPSRVTGGKKSPANPTTLPALDSLTAAEKKARLLQWSKVRHFLPEEFDSPDQPGSGLLMNIEFVLVLDNIRHDCGFPFVIRPPDGSGYRTPEHNKKVGGKQKSGHLKAVAVDTSCMDADKRFKIVFFAMKHGIKRIGIGENFVHLDMDYALPQGVLWLYPSKAKANAQ